MIVFLVDSLCNMLLRTAVENVECMFEHKGYGMLDTTIEEYNGGDVYKQKHNCFTKTFQALFGTSWVLS